MRERKPRVRALEHVLRVRRQGAEQGHEAYPPLPRQAQQCSEAEHVRPRISSSRGTARSRARDGERAGTSSQLDERALELDDLGARLLQGVPLSLGLRVLLLSQVHLLLLLMQLVLHLSDLARQLIAPVATLLFFAGGCAWRHPPAGPRRQPRRQARPGRPLSRQARWGASSGFREGTRRGETWRVQKRFSRSVDAR